MIYTRSNDNDSTSPVLPKELTKREYFAIMALQGLLQSGNGLRYGDCVENSVYLADLLLEKLEAK